MAARNETYKKRIESGKCVNCGRNSIPGKTRCKVHTMEAKARSVSNRMKNKRFPWKEKGEMGLIDSHIAMAVTLLETLCDLFKNDIEMLREYQHKCRESLESVSESQIKSEPENEKNSKPENLENPKPSTTKEEEKEINMDEIDMEDVIFEDEWENESVTR